MPPYKCTLSSVVYFGRGTLPQQRCGKRALLGDLAKREHGLPGLTGSAPFRDQKHFRLGPARRSRSALAGAAAAAPGPATGRLRRCWARGRSSVVFLHRRVVRMSSKCQSQKSHWASPFHWVSGGVLERRIPRKDGMEVPSLKR